MAIHDALCDRIEALYVPSVSQVLASGPFNKLAEEVSALCETDVSVLDAFPARMLTHEPGSVKAAAWVLAFEKAALTRLGPWFTPQLALGYPVGIRHFGQNPNGPAHDQEESVLAPHWARVCPPPLAQWLVIPPSQSFENDHVERTWRGVMERISSRLLTLIENQVPGWDVSDLQQAWVRPMLDGIRPGSLWTGSPQKDQRTAAQAQRVFALTEPAVVIADPCYDRWKIDWQKNRPVWAAWQMRRAQQATPLANVSSRTRSRP
jgi:hypothetical protein